MKFSYFNHRLSICVDPKYIQKLEELFSLSHRKPQAAPCGDDVLKVDPNPVHLGAEDHRKYRTAIGILLYISGDRPDIQFAVNVLSSGLTAPTKRQQKQLEHLILYLTGTRDFHYVFSGKAVGTSVLNLKANHTLSEGNDDGDPESSQEEVEEATHLLEVFTDSDWASCHGARRSTSCAVLALNGSVVYSYSRRQKVVSLSSGEAEYYAAASGASEGVYLKNIVQFLTGKPVRLVLRCDSQAACGVIQRQGAQGRVKHISLKVLWLQDLCQSGILSITAVQTRYNLADTGTKALTASRARFLLSLFRFFTGNPDSHEAVDLQEQAEQLDIEALQVLRALCRDSDFHRRDRSVLRSLVDSVHGSNSSRRSFNNSPTRNYNIGNNNRSCMFALLVSSFLTGSTATSPTTMEQDTLAGIKSWLLRLLSHLAVVLFTFAVWWCSKKEKRQEKVEKKVFKGKAKRKGKCRRNRSLGTTSSQEATQEEEENEEQEEEENEGKQEEEEPSSSKDKPGKFGKKGESKSEEEERKRKLKEALEKAAEENEENNRRYSEEVAKEERRKQEESRTIAAKEMRKLKSVLRSCRK